MMLAALVLAAVFSRPMERVSTIDPALARSVCDSHAVQLLYEPILEVDYRARPYRLTAGYCELPEISEDALCYRFKVRAGGRAEDAVRSLERLRDKEVVSPNGWIMKDVDTVEAVEGNVVEIRLKRRCHFFSWLMAMSATGVRDSSTPEGWTGPYALTLWRKNHEMRFTRRDGVAGGFDEIRYLVIDDMSTQWLMFLRGEVDLLDEISRDNWDSIAGPDGRIDPALEREGVELHSIPTLEVMTIGINMNDSVLGGNRKLRQALNAAFDYPAWEKFYNGRIARSDGPVPPGVEGRLETPFAYAYDLEKAKKLMVEAGYPNGIDPKTGRRLVLTLTIGRPNQESREAGELIAAFYERIGIKLELAFLTWNAFLKAVNEGRTQMFRLGWVGDYPDAQNFLQLFHSRNVNPGPNHAGYRNDAYDAEYDLALAAPTAEERNRHWAKCQEIVREDCPWVFTHFNKSYSLVRPSVRNYVPSGFPYGMEKYYENAVH